MPQNIEKIRLVFGTNTRPIAKQPATHRNGSQDRGRLSITHGLSLSNFANGADDVDAI